jgi:lysophospholipase L1-like esterase
VSVPDVEYVRRHDRIALVARMTRRLRVAQLVVAGWDRLQNTGTVLGPRVPLDDYRAYLREIVETAKARGVRVVLLTRPFVGSSTDPASWKAHAPDYNAATLDLARREHVPVVDVYEAFKNQTALFDDESHFGVEGHRVAARLLVPVVSALLPR